MSISWLAGTRRWAGLWGEGWQDDMLISSIHYSKQWFPSALLPWQQVQAGHSWLLEWLCIQDRCNNYEGLMSCNPPYQHFHIIQRLCAQVGLNINSPSQCSFIWLSSHVIVLTIGIILSWAGLMTPGTSKKVSYPEFMLFLKYTRRSTSKGSYLHTVSHFSCRWRFYNRTHSNLVVLQSSDRQSLVGHCSSWRTWWDSKHDVIHYVYLLSIAMAITEQINIHKYWVPRSKLAYGIPCCGHEYMAALHVVS